MAAAQFTRPDSRDDVSDPRGECVSASLWSRRLTRAAGRILASTAIATGVDLTTLEGSRSTRVVACSDRRHADVTPS